jgi:hypothetical protein
VYRGDRCGRYTAVTVVLGDGKEVSGLMLGDAFKKLRPQLRGAHNSTLERLTTKVIRSLKTVLWP